MSDIKKDQFTGILAGWDGLIREHYGLQYALTTKTGAREAYLSTSDLTPLFNDLFERIEQNMNPSPSPRVGDSNWKLRRAKDRSDHNESLEKLLEKRVVNLPPHDDGMVSLGGWFNQIPACSGYANSKSNRKNSIDLVYEGERGGEYFIIELKLDNGSGTPFYAAYENLSYGFLYLLSRTNECLRSIFKNAPEKPILTAERIRLVVLSPASYYEENQPFAGSLKEFEQRVHAALGAFAKTKDPRLEMGFEFRQFQNPVSSREEIDCFEGFEPAPYGGRVPFLT
jgi:hypothetical protein